MDIRGRSGRGRGRRAGLLATLLAELSLLLAGLAPAATADSGSLRDVVLVGNSSDGTVTLLDGHTFKNLGSINVIPDKQALFDSWDIFRKALHDIIVSQTQGEHYVDDAHLSPD